LVGEEAEDARPMNPRRQALIALMFLLPNILGFLIFTAWPVVASLLLSFTSWDLLTPARWVGLANFKELLGFHRVADGWHANDPNFWKYFGNTLFLLMALPVNMMLSLCLAMVLNQKLRFTYGYRLVFFLPSVVSGIAIFYLWRWMYNPDFGLVNAMLAQVGIEGPRWLTDVKWAKPALMLMGAWLAVGGTGMVLYLAALQGVSPELHEAAAIDGANAWQRFWAVTWPAVMPVTFFIFTMGLIHGLQAGFDAAYVMTGGGPFGATTTLGYYIYQKAYVFFEMGYASAIAWVLFLIILAVTTLNWRHGGKAMAA
jgi:multiple sugar transport system permease protein